MALNKRVAPFRFYSQHGEESILIDYFTINSPKYKYLVDVGAYGKELSNTFALLNFGWHGLLIEANPSRIPIIQNDFKNLDVKIINNAITPYPENTYLYINSVSGNDSLLSTWHLGTRTKKRVKVIPRTLSDVLLENSTPLDFDLLSIDIEGMDFCVMEHLFNHSLYRPDIIITEIDSYEKPLSFFSHFGYYLYRVVGSPQDGNLIFKRKF